MQIRSLAQALTQLESSFALEQFSPLTGEPVLVVDLTHCDSTTDAKAILRDALRLETARHHLQQLPCPTVALTAAPTQSTAKKPPKLPLAARELLSDFDIVLDDAADLEAIFESVRNFPLASMAAAQLLRHSEALSVHEGLIAESLVYSTLQSGPEFQNWLKQRSIRSPRKENLEPAVLAERIDTCLRLTLNRPEKRNAFSAAMRDALAEALQIAIHDPSLKEVFITGAGPAFCSGGDLDEFGSLPDPATAHAIRSTRNAGRLITACKEKVRFHVRGACVGAGMELPAFAHFVSAEPDSFFQLPEVALGLVPGAGGTVSIPRRIGRQRTAWLALTRQCIDAKTALAWGLIDAIKQT